MIPVNVISFIMELTMKGIVYFYKPLLFRKSPDSTPQEIAALILNSCTCLIY
jgi:hypothetical protein